MKKRRELINAIPLYDSLHYILFGRYPIPYVDEVRELLEDISMPTEYDRVLYLASIHGKDVIDEYIEIIQSEFTNI